MQPNLEEGSIFLKITLFILVLLFLSGTFIYFSMKSDNTAQSSIKPTEKITVKQYVNNQYGYSLAYPASWGATTELSEGGVVLFSNPEYLQMRVSDPMSFNKEDYAEIITGIYSFGTKTAWGTVTENTTAKDFALKASGSINITATNDIQVGGKTGIVLVTDRMILKPGIPFGIQNCPPDQQPCEVKDGTLKQVWVKIPKGILFIKYSYGRGYLDAAGVEKTFYDILQSVKFK